MPERRGDLAGERACGALFVMHRDDDGDIGDRFVHPGCLAGFRAGREMRRAQAGSRRAASGRAQTLTHRQAPC